MQQVLKLSLFTFLLIIVASSCKKKVTIVNQDYIGSWSSMNLDASYSIYVGDDSQASYKKIKGATTITSDGKARIEGDKFKIGFKKFDVIQHPVIDTLGVYSMILDDVTYYKY